MKQDVLLLLAGAFLPLTSLNGAYLRKEIELRHSPILIDSEYESNAYTVLLEGDKVELFLAGSADRNFIYFFWQYPYKKDSSDLRERLVFELHAPELMQTIRVPLGYDGYLETLRGVASMSVALNPDGPRNSLATVNDDPDSGLRSVELAIPVDVKADWDYLVARSADTNRRLILEANLPDHYGTGSVYRFEWATSLSWTAGEGFVEFESSVDPLLDIVPLEITGTSRSVWVTDQSDSIVNFSYSENSDFGRFLWIDTNDGILHIEQDGPRGPDPLFSSEFDLGRLFADELPWVFHPYHGWFFFDSSVSMAESKLNGRPYVAVYAYQFASDHWLFIPEPLTPYLYDLSSGSWLYFRKDSPWYFQYDGQSGGNWMTYKNDT